ncbi:segregation and condensation protein B [Clostridia bacterium]|nr:segregation and condensation protein B [Clostridia bacterium]
MSDNTGKTLPFPSTKLYIGDSRQDSAIDAIDTTASCSAILEACLFASGEPISIPQVAKLLGMPRQKVARALIELQREYDEDARGIRISIFGDSAQMTTRSAYAHIVRQLVAPAQRQTLRQSALETLAIIAYRQPVTRQEIDQIRGVQSNDSVRALLQKGLIRELGQRDTLGHPMELGTTDLFLSHFGMNSLLDLPAENIP